MPKKQAEKAFFVSKRGMSQTKRGEKLQKMTKVE